MIKKKVGKLSEDFLSRNSNDNVKSINEEVKEENEIYYCPLDNCQFSCNSKQKLMNHLNYCRALDHVQYREQFKQLKEQCQQSLDYLVIGCISDNSKKCCQCSNINCLKKEFALYIQIKKKAERIQNEKVRTSLSKNARYLFDWFYDQTNTNSFNTICEISKLKKLLKAGNDIDSIKLALQLLIEQGQKNLQYLGKYVIEQANRYSLYLKQINIQDTIPFLIHQYYEQLGIKYSLYLFGSNTEKVEAVQKTFKISINQLKKVIDYMIYKKISTFAYIDKLIPKIILMDSFQIQQVPKNDDYVASVIDELLRVSTNIYEVQNTYDKEFTNSILQRVKQILFSESFNPKFLAIEWLYLIKYPLDKESYDFAKQNAFKHHRKAQFQGEQQNQYKAWLLEQVRKFEAK